MNQMIPTDKSLFVKERNPRIKFKPFLIFILLSILSCTTYGQTILTGLIKDGKGGAVESATVKVKNTLIATVADTRGAFSIPAPKEVPFTLLISSAGYTSSEVLITELKDTVLNIILVDNNQLSAVVISSRRRVETAQSVPIAISVIGGSQVQDAGAFNVNRLKELVPTVQLYSSNPRNTTLNVRGLGSTFGLTNDGIDPGVGFYVDGVYYARAAATSLDFIDIDQIEVLRGPQGTLFGKNTTAGAFNITTRAPRFKRGVNFEMSYGNYGFIQAKASVTGALSKKIAGRLSISGTQRDGVLFNVATQKPVNDLNNLGVRGQLLYTPSEKVKILFIGDVTNQNPDGYAQVVAGVVKTQRAGYRQFDSIIADLGYQLPTRNPFDRIIDHNTPARSGNQLGGASLNVDIKTGAGTLTSTTAWRYWNWDPSSDRDFTGLPVLTLSQATSKHQQLTQEVRYAGEFSSKLSGVLGGFYINQDLKADPYQIEESGPAQWRFSQSSRSSLWQTPGMFDGYGIRTYSRLKTTGAALFGQLDWTVGNSLHILPGLRYNYDKKDVMFERTTYGGLQTTDSQLVALKQSVYTNQAFDANVDESNFSGQVTLSYKANNQINTFATYSISYKPVGINLGGLPTAGGRVLTELARVKPEHVNHFEVGVKTSPLKNAILNITYYNTQIRDYQTNVQTAEVGVNRGYLANAEKVRVTGLEMDANVRFSDQFTFYGNLAYTDGKYVKFTNAPTPLEETGASKAFKDVSGGVLPGISKWASSVGGEVSTKNHDIMGQPGKYFVAVDGYYRSSFSSSPSPSAYLNVDGYALLNSRFGFRAQDGLSIFFWGRNLLSKDYFEQLLPAAGNAGHYAGVLGDPRTYGITLRYSL